MKKYFLTLSAFLLLLFCLAFCNRNPDRYLLKNESLASPELRNDTLTNLLNCEVAQTFKGEKGVPAGTPKVIIKKMLKLPDITEDNVWVEQWIVQRKGYYVAYDITFIPVETGGTNISIKYPPVHVDRL